MIELRRPTWSNARHATQWENTLAAYAHPVIGNKTVDSITSADAMAVLTPIWTTKPETASRVRQRVETVMDWAITHGYRLDNAFTVTDGSVSNVLRLEPGKNVRWKITVEPDSNADVTIALNATTNCSAEGAICTSDGGMLSGGLELVVPGPPSNSAATGAPTIDDTAQVGGTLTANTTGIADADGLVNASFTYQWLADDTEISGATGSSYVVATADAGKVIKVTVTFTDDAGNEESVSSAATAAVARPPLTATVHNKPSSHDGSAAFTFELRLSENIESFSYTTLQDHALTVTGGTGLKVRRLEAMILGSSYWSGRQLGTLPWTACPP